MSEQHVFWALVNALWQSTAIALIVGAGLHFIPRTTAAQRYVMWCAVLVAAALLPIADLAMPSRTIALPVSESPVPVVARVVSEVVLQPLPATSMTVATTVGQKAPAQPARHLPSPLLLVWLGIASMLLARLGLAYASLKTVKSSLVTSNALTARVQGFGSAWSRRVVVGISPCVAEPCAIGFLHPAIALSEAMAEALPDGDLERVLRHECAHVRRYDDYANLVQRLLAAVLWFNPVVHIAGRAMAVEREIACDDAAAAASDERVAFARCLYEIARTAPRRRHAAASGFIGSRRQIAVRVARLVERNHNASTRLGTFAKVTAITVLAISIALAGVRLTALAVPAQTQPQVATSFEQDVVLRLSEGEPATEASVKPAAEASVKPAAEASVKPAVLHVKKTVTVVNTRVARRVAVATAPPAPPLPANDRRSSRGLIDALADAGFKNLSIDDLVSLANRGVTPALVDELHRDGLTPMPASTLARFADSGVTGAYIAGLAQLGYPNLAPEDYIRLRDSGVTLEFVQRIQSSGLIEGHPTVDQLIRLRDAGV
jgi:beta-lactamase regulating signal transducer with metallopeptidase domain